MPHYQSSTKQIFWYDSEADHDNFAPQGLAILTDAQADAILNPPATLAQAQLAKTDSLAIAYAAASGLTSAGNCGVTWKQVNQGHLCLALIR